MSKLRRYKISTVNYFTFWHSVEIGWVSMKPIRKNGHEDTIHGIEGLGDKVRRYKPWKQNKQGKEIWV